MLLRSIKMVSYHLDLKQALLNELFMSHLIPTLMNIATSVATSQSLSMCDDPP
jgi:hypothetical protein